MAASETIISNQALGKLGAASIVSLDDPSANAIACKLFYELTRDEVLRAHRWNFAIKRAELSQLAEAPLFGWGVQYALPVDCLRVLQLNGYEEWQEPDRWEVEGRSLLTDEDVAQIKYIARITDANLFDSLFIEALSVKLASNIAMRVTGSDSKSEGLAREYELITGARAMRANAMERRPKRKLAWVESDLVKARR